MTTQEANENHKKLKIVFFATGEFAVPSMKTICESGEFEIAGLVTSPPRYDKCKERIITPARTFAAEHNVRVLFDFDDFDVHSWNFGALLRLYRPDLLFVCDFGYILKDNVLDAAVMGGINLHGSLLPRYRGAAPVQWAIMNNDEFTGVSIIRMTSKVDAGQVIAQSPPLPIPPRALLAEVEEMLAEYGSKLVLQTLRRMASSEPVKIIEQIDIPVTKAPRLKKENGLINWNTSAVSIFNHYRVMSKWPKIFTDWVREDGSTTRMILGQILPLDDSFQPVIKEDFTMPQFVPPMLFDAKLDNLAELRSEPDNKTKRGSKSLRKQDAKKERHTFVRKTSPPPEHQRHQKRPDWWKPGTIVNTDEGRLIIAAGEGVIQVLQLQPAGKNMMSASGFLCGYPVKIGTMLR